MISPGDYGNLSHYSFPRKINQEFLQISLKVIISRFSEDLEDLVETTSKQISIEFP